MGVHSLGYGLDQVAQGLVLADGDGEAYVHLAADGDHGVGVEAAVGTHREWPGGSGMADPPHRLSQEVGGAPSGVGPALAQPGHQHVAGARGYCEERVIAPHAGVVVALRALLGQPKGLADGCVPGRSSTDRRQVPLQQPRLGPATLGPPDPTGARGPIGNSAGRFPAWTAP